ncbi:hypothetical protein NGRA_1535 [Nosema granulosis]|uniref:Uncharacterized protein n=1 Tax=Nosema granulosis TaxID=83296 RepID=A0A9P6GYU0_9MICR|nr:hypothetical protein NGRA_1535 [Nosema granulosis]
MLYTIKKNTIGPNYKKQLYTRLENVYNVNVTHKKTQGGEILVETPAPLEKIGFYLMFLEQYKPILTCIDYHTRKVNDRRLLKDKTNYGVLNAIKKIISEMGAPKQIVIDYGKE